MKSGAVISILLACTLALFAVMQSGHAASVATGPSSRIGLVSIRAVFAGSKKYSQRQNEAARRASQAKTQLAELAKRADAEEGELSVLKQATSDYVKQFQAVLEARSKLQNQQELSKQQRMLEDMRSFEEFYEETLKAVEAVAKEKGVSLVLERTQPRFPIAAEDITLTIATQKVLYAADAVDLTDDVIARVDAGVNSKP